QIPGRATEREIAAAARQPVAVHDVIGTVLRQSVPQLVPVLPAIARARDEQFSVERHALCVRFARHEPSGFAVLLVDRYGEAEVHALLGAADFAPGARAVRAAEHARVVLLP